MNERIMGSSPRMVDMNKPSQKRDESRRAKDNRRQLETTRQMDNRESGGRKGVYECEDEGPFDAALRLLTS